MSNGLETSFRFNSQENGLVIHAKENFVNNNWGALLLVGCAPKSYQHLQKRTQMRKLDPNL
jgi:hypothetical protein